MEKTIDQVAYRVEQLTHLVEEQPSWNDEGKSVVQAYVEDGDLDKFIQQGERLYDPTDKAGNAHRWVLEDYCNDVLSFETVMYYGANPTYSNVVERLETYLNWILDSPNTRGFSRSDSTELSFEQRWFMSHPRKFFFTYSYCFTQEDWSKLFHWIYGEHFSSERIIPMKIDYANWKANFIESGQISCNSEIALLMLKLRSYIFIRNDQHRDYVSSYFEPVVEYVFPLIESIPAEYFDIELAERNQKNQHGEKTYKNAFQASIGSLFGSIVAYQEGFNFLDAPDLHVRDQKMFQHVCQKINEIVFPKEYYELMQYVKDQGENFYYARLGVL